MYDIAEHIKILKQLIQMRENKRNDIEKEIYGDILDVKNLALKREPSKGMAGNITGSGITDESEYAKKLERANEEWARRQGEIDELDNEIRKYKKQVEKLERQNNMTKFNKKVNEVLEWLNEEGEAGAMSGADYVDASVNDPGSKDAIYTVARPFRSKKNKKVMFRRKLK